MTSSKGGQPPAELDLDAFRQLCVLQCTEEEIAGFFKVNRRTIIRRMKSHPEYQEAWDYGKANGRASLRRLQWKHAQGAGSGAVQMTIHLSKHWLGESEKSLVEHAGKDGGPIKTERLEIVYINADQRDESKVVVDLRPKQFQLAHEQGET
jgi:hypothetical protein